MWKRSWPITRKYAGIRLEVLRKNLKHPSEDSLYPERDSNRTSKIQAISLSQLRFLMSCTFPEHNLGDQHKEDEMVV
jgi:hypothetical protein